MKKFVIISFTLLLSTAYFYSCSSVTEIQGTWKKPGTVAKSYKKIAVMGQSNDQVKKAKVENAVVNNLRTYGINAVAGSNLLPNTFLDSDKDGKVDEAKKDQIGKTLEDAGCDGAFVISLLNVKNSESYVPGTSFYAPYSGYYGFNSFYWGTFNTVNSPGYFVQNTNYYLSSNFYDLSNEQLVWSAQSNTGDPQNINDFATSFATAVVQDFVSSGVVKK